MSISNSNLVAAIVDGEIHRFAEIVQRFDDRVRQVIARDVVDAAAREDLVQETFYRAFMSLDKLRDAEQLESWLLVIARNCTRDHFRKVRRREQKESTAAVHEAGEFASRMALQKVDWIWQEVDQLQPNFAEMLRLRYQQNMAYSEIADHLGLIESTVRGRIFEARKALRHRLTDNGLFP